MIWTNVDQCSTLNIWTENGYLEEGHAQTPHQGFKVLIPKAVFNYNYQTNGDDEIHMSHEFYEGKQYHFSIFPRNST